MDSPQPKTSKFPIAKPVKPLFEIGGKIYQRVPHSDGITNADAIRGQVLILSGPDKGGWKVGWFVLLYDPRVETSKMEAT